MLKVGDVVRWVRSSNHSKDENPEERLVYFEKPPEAELVPWGTLAVVDKVSADFHRHVDVVFCAPFSGRVACGFDMESFKKVDNLTPEERAAVVAALMTRDA